MTKLKECLDAMDKNGIQILCMNETGINAQNVNVQNTFSHAFSKMWQRESHYINSVQETNTTKKQHGGIGIIYHDTITPRIQTIPKTPEAAGEQ